MDEEKGDDASPPPLEPSSASPFPVSVAPAAAASSPSKQSGLKRGREEEHSQRDASSSSSSPSIAAAVDSNARAATTVLPPSKAPRAARTADASSAAAAVSAAASASPSVSRSRIPQAAAAAVSSPASSAAAAASSPMPQQHQPSPAVSAPESSSASVKPESDEEDGANHERDADAVPPRRRRRKPTPRPRPLSKQFPRLASLAAAAADNLEMRYGIGDPLQLYERSGWYRVNFDQLYKRAVKQGLFPPDRDLPAPSYADDAALSSALQLLYHLRDRHAEFAAIPRVAETGVEYLDLGRDCEVVMVNGEPFVTLLCLHQTLLHLAWLSQDEFEAREAQIDELNAAMDGIWDKQPGFNKPDKTISGH